jgi:hypothetical protein
MNKTIWKFPVKITDDTFLSMPKDAEILSFQLQSGIPCMWALVDEDAEKIERHFEMFGTGHLVPCDKGINRKYIGSVILIKHYNQVYHLFERF